MLIKNSTLTREDSAAVLKRVKCRSLCLTLVRRASAGRFWWLICLSSRLSYSWSISSGMTSSKPPLLLSPPPPFKPPLPPGKEIRSVSPCLCKKRLSLFHSRTHPEHNVRDPKTRAHTQVAYSANKPNGLVSLASSSKLSWFKHTRLKSQFRLRRSKLA